MKTRKYLYKKAMLLAMSLGLLVSCERDLSDLAVLATFPNTADIFTDAPVGLTDEFFDSFDPAEGANPDGFGTDNNVSYLGSSSIRIDVPAANDPNGGFIGGIFKDRGEGRDLTGYTALTFWAKGSTTATIGTIGFGTDFEENEFKAEANDIQLTTDWAKYVIPIPDPSKLVQEKGLFLFSAGSESTGGSGWTFWIDELRFENLGNIGQSRPRIFAGSDSEFISVPGQSLSIAGFTHTFNLGNGRDITVKSNANYYDFVSDNPSVASVSSEGLVTVLTTGEATINASVAGDDASGSVIVQSFEDQRIISIFSDFYADVPVDNYNGFYEPFQTTLGGLVDEAGNNIVDYTVLNFVAIEFYGRSNPNAAGGIDATQMTNLNIDLRVNEPIQASDALILELINNFGPGQTSGTYTITGDNLRTGEFITFSIPFSDFSGGLANRNALGALLFNSNETIRNLSIDNIYLSKEVIEPTPNVNDTNATQAELPLGFESSSVTYSFTGFEGSDPAIETNPDQTGINPTSTVMRMTKTNGAQWFAGTFLDLDAPIDFSSSQKIRLKVWSPKADIPIRFAVETSAGSGQVFVDATIPVANEWVELEFDFGNVYNPSTVYERFIVFFEFVDGLAGDGSTYYYDDVKVLN